MIGRAVAAGRPAALSASVLVTCVAAALALGASPAFAACPNVQLQSESNINSATGEPYSNGLPDCRAYEVVSPSYKQGHDATPAFQLGGMPVAPDGNTAGFWSEGVFAGPENFLLQGFFSQYLSQRGEKEWITSSTFLPRKLVDFPYGLGINGDSSVDLRSLRLSCGQNPAGREPSEPPGGVGFACAFRGTHGSPTSTGTYRNLSGTAKVESQYAGASSDLSRAFIMTGTASPPFV